ncbi:MAG: hypothetical protein ACKO86_14110, partial [Dolichospermum sp.]
SINNTMGRFIAFAQPNKKSLLFAFLDKFIYQISIMVISSNKVRSLLFYDMIRANKSNKLVKSSYLEY